MGNIKVVRSQLVERIEMAKRIWLLAIFLLLSFAVTTNWHRVSSSNNAERDRERPIVIGYSNWAGWWPWAIAESKGLFAKHGANVELKWYDNYTQSIEDLAAGYIDGNSQTLNDTISQARDAVEGEVVVLVNDNSAGNDKVIGAAGVDEVKDLAGKQVILEAGVVGDFLLSLALEQEDLSREDIETLDLETGAGAAAFAAGQGNAIVAFPPFWFTALKREEAKEIISSFDFPGAIPHLLVVTESLIKQNPQQVQALIDSWFEAMDFIAANIVEADEIMAERAGISYARLQLLKSGTRMFSLEDNLEAFRKGRDMKHLSYAARKITVFLRRKLKSIDRKPNLSKLFNSSFIKSYAL